MKYRKMGNLNWEVSALGFGCMRLPTKSIINKETNSSKQVIDKEYAIEMIRYGIDQGINYIDTAWPYHDGESELVVGEALKGKYREKVKLVTKLPTWLIKGEEDFDKFLNNQLKKLQTNYLDVYLLHSLGKDLFETVKKFDLVTKMEAAKANGLIKHIGFSFHDSLKVFKEIIDFYNWDVAQIQYNYFDPNYQAGVKGLKYAADKGIAMIIMEPLWGGKLTQSFSEVEDIIKKAHIKRSLADWAFQFLWNQPEVSVVLSGMGELWQVEENLESANNSAIGSLKKEDMEIISKLRKTYSKFITIPCTNCEYCMPCPNSVNIPQNIRFLNDFIWFGEEQRERFEGLYTKFLKTKEELKESEGKGAGNASLCIECGECIEKCPQKIQIPEVLKKVDAILGKKQKISNFF
ncbi:MAG: aldo/keto reductase [Promethearchaeota archaeon]|nr:MAG: aldo/keto reductase [Candidatus Lokiarchaeota archaeon]